MRVRSMLALAGALLVLVGTSAEPMAAQERPFTVQFTGSHAQIAAVLDRPITAYVGDVECGSVDLSTGERDLVVGGPGTPDDCRTPGRTVDLVPQDLGRHDPMSAGGEPPPQLVIRPGTTVEVVSLVPPPTVLGPLPAFMLMVHAGIDDSPLTPPLRAYVDGFECGESLMEADGSYWLPVGRHDEESYEPIDPDACYQELAVVTLRDSAGRTLFVTPTLHVGQAPLLLTDFELAEPAPPTAGQFPIEAGSRASFVTAIAAFSLSVFVLSARLVTALRARG